MSICDGFCNLVGYTNNERKRDEYAKVVEKLDGYLSKLSNYISECRSDYAGFEDGHASNNGSNSYGEAIYRFRNKAEVIHSDNLSYIKALENGYDAVSSRRNQAQSVYDNYVEAVAEDERREREERERKEREKREKRKREKEERERNGD